MKTEKKVSADILFHSLDIQKKHPELSKNLIETPLHKLEYNEPGLSKKELEDYLESIETLISHSKTTSIGDRGLVPSHPRTDARRDLDAQCIHIDLTAEIDNIKREGNWSEGIQSAKTLVKSNDLSVVLIALHQGNEIKMHQSDGPITIQVLEGCIQFKTQNQQLTLQDKGLVSLQAEVPHHLIANEQSLILLTLISAKKIVEKNATEKQMEKNDQETIKKSDNLQYPDFPTYPPEDDVYITEEKQ